MGRRRLITGLVGLIAVPAIVRAESIMAVKPLVHLMPVAQTPDAYTILMEHIQRETAAALGIPKDMLQPEKAIIAKPVFRYSFPKQNLETYILQGFDLSSRFKRIDSPGLDIQIDVTAHTKSLYAPTTVSTKSIDQRIALSDTLIKAVDDAVRDSTFNLT